MGKQFAFPYSPNFFKDNLEYSEQIKQQETECRKALNEGDLRMMRNTINTLHLLITKKMIPKEDLFKTEINELDAKLEEKKAPLKQKYEDDCAEALTPDLVPAPDYSNLHREYYEMKFNILVEFLDRLGLGLQHEKEGHF